MATNFGATYRTPRNGRFASDMQAAVAQHSVVTRLSQQMMLRSCGNDLTEAQESVLAEALVLINAGRANVVAFEQGGGRGLLVDAMQSFGTAYHMLDAANR